MSITAVIFLLSELLCPAVSHSLLRRGASAKADPPVLSTAGAASKFSGGGSASSSAVSSKVLSAPVAAAPADGFTGDPALAIVAGSGGGDYYTQAWTGENAGDTKRGTGGCTGWRSTLQCNPSGPRDPK